MEIANIRDARSRLSRLVAQALQGEEVVIARAGKPLVRLVPIESEPSPRVGGQWRGRVWMSEEFDTPPEDLAEVLGMDIERRHSRPPMTAGPSGADASKNSEISEERPRIVGESDDFDVL